MKETKILKVTITGTELSIKNQFKLLTNFTDTKVEDLTEELKNLRFAIEILCKD